MSTMASILACNELVRLIVLELRPVYSADATTYEAVLRAKAIRQEGRRDLASAALVCRAFTEHALDALWEVLDSLLPIFTVLPSFRTHARRSLDLVSCLSPEDWALLRSYGRRVKELHHKWSDIKCIRPCVLPILMASFHASEAPLLPHLQRLQLLNLDTEATVCTIPLLSSTLQSVTVSFDVGGHPKDPKIKDRDNFEMFLSALSVASPGLQELHVSSQFRTFHMGKKHVDSLSRFAHLQNFSSSITLNPAAWSKLASMGRSLQYLDISIRSLDSLSNLESGSHLENTDADVTPESYALALPNLHSAKITGPLDTLCVFVDYLHSPALQSVTLNVYSSPAPSALRDFLDLVRRKLSFLRKLTLQSPSMRQPDTRPYEEPEPVNLAPLLPPLASLAELKDLSLDFFEIPMYVSDDAFRTLADGLPALVSFVLRYKLPHYYRHTAADAQAVPNRRPTIAALVALANGCPHLARLHIVDVDVDAETPKDYVVPALDHPLRELEIASFNARTRGRVFRFAEMLHRIFPRLGDVRSQGASSGWNVAKEYLEYLQTV